MLLRSLAIFVGCLIVAATTHVAIISAGGYGSTSAPLQIAVALGLCTASVCTGAAWGDGRWILGFVFLFVMVAGEALAILTTSEVTLAARDAAAAPLVELAKKRSDALGELAAADTASPAPADKSRLQAAEKAKSNAETAVREKAADKACLANCRLLLQSAVDAAQREVAAARAELDERTRNESQRLQDRRTAARAAVASLPPARSATPLADRLRVAAWALDLLIAGLRSIAANGLGAALIAFGAHAGGSARGKLARCDLAPLSEAQVASVASTPALLALSAHDHAVRFSREMLAPAEFDTPVSALHQAYLRWCLSKTEIPYSLREIGRELANLFARLEIEIIEIAGTKFVARVEIKSGPDMPI